MWKNNKFEYLVTPPTFLTQLLQDRNTKFNSKTFLKITKSNTVEYKLSQVQTYVLILEVATVQFMSIFSGFLGTFWPKTLDSVTMATEVKI